MTGNAIPDTRLMTRIIVGGLPEILLQVVVDLLQRQPDVIVTAVVHDPVDLLVAATEEPDLAVIGSPQTEPLPGIVSHLLTQFPALKVLVLTPQNDEVMACWMGLKQQSFRIDSGQQLVRVVHWLSQLDVLAGQE
jgi:DNA-binding transcriptional LysR family regulator